MKSANINVMLSTYLSSHWWHSLRRSALRSSSSTFQISHESSSLGRYLCWSSSPADWRMVFTRSLYGKTRNLIIYLYFRLERVVSKHCMTIISPFIMYVISYKPKQFSKLSTVSTIITNTVSQILPSRNDILHVIYSI